MLKMFKVKNYTSFKDEAILDMRANAYVQHPSHIVSINSKLGLLKVAALYGANASGKSNFIAAMYFFKRFILSHFFSNKEDIFVDLEDDNFTLRFEQFALCQTKNEVSEFDIIFVRNGKQIQYGFDCTSDIIAKEWLFIDDKQVFERTGNELSFGANYKKTLAQYTKLPSERLYVAVLDYFLEDVAKTEILGDLIAFLKDDFNVFLEIVFESTVKGIVGFVGLNKRLVSSVSFRNKVAQYLRQIDVGITGLDVQTELVEGEEIRKKRKEKTIRTIHNTYNEHGEIVGESYFDLRQESSGTLRFLTYIQNIIELTSKGGVFIIDEMSARLHPLLTKLIVDIFCSSQNKKAQLIFTTHDISLLNNNQFRRDEVVFVDKNERGESTLYSLSDFKVREDATFAKDYLQGKYGAIPMIHYVDNTGGD